MIDFIIRRIKKVDSIDEVVLCTSYEEVDDALEHVANENKVSCFRGEPDEVIDRMLKVANLKEADILVRVTGDNVLTLYEYLNTQIDLLKEHNLDYLRIVDVPLGATPEVIRKEALEHCYNSMNPLISEYLMLYIFQPANYKCGVMRVTKEDKSGITLTVDTKGDLIRTREILTKYSSVPKEDITLNEILKIIEEFEIGNAVFSPSGEVKLPYGKKCSFQEFKQNMSDREEESIQFNLIGRNGG